MKQNVQRPRTRRRRAKAQEENKVTHNRYYEVVVESNEIWYTLDIFQIAVKPGSRRSILDVQTSWKMVRPHITWPQHGSDQVPHVRQPSASGQCQSSRKAKGKQESIGCGITCCLALCLPAGNEKGTGAGEQDWLHRMATLGSSLRDCMQ